jgi:chorismate mutase
MDFRASLAVAACACAVAVSTGCTKIESCNVSPIEIEELREDISIIDKDLGGVHERRQQLADELAAKQADLDSKQDKPEALRARLELLKRGSGRIEKKTDAKKTDTKKDSKGSS